MAWSTLPRRSPVPPQFRNAELNLLRSRADRAFMAGHATLHDARTRKNLSLAELSSRTSLSPAVVRKIDEGRFGELPPGLSEGGLLVTSLLSAGGIGIAAYEALKSTIQGVIEDYLKGHPRRQVWLLVAIFLVAYAIIAHRYVTLALEHWGDDEHGRARARDFLVWHIGFWCRYAPRRDDGSYPTMQEREARRDGLTPLDALLARTDADAHGWVADRLLAGDEIIAEYAPASRGAEARSGVEAAG